MIGGLALLLVCQLFGEVAARGANLPVPGPVIGLLLLVLTLTAAEKFGRLRPETLGETGIGRVCDGFLAHLGLLFVPAGVGIVQHLDMIGDHGAALGLALVGSTLITLLATVGVFLLVKRMFGPREVAR